MARDNVLHFVRCLLLNDHWSLPKHNMVFEEAVVGFYPVTIPALRTSNAFLVCDLIWFTDVHRVLC